MGRPLPATLRRGSEKLCRREAVGHPLPATLCRGSEKLYDAPMIYTAQNLDLPHALFYSWTGWPEQGTTFAGSLSQERKVELMAAWQHDGFTPESLVITATKAHLTCAVTPDITPVFYAARAKGRLQHALRQAGMPCAFSRKASVRALGKNITHVVQAYIRNQLEHVELADPRYRKRLAEAAYDDPKVQLENPVELNRSRYWYNLHIVLVVANRFRLGGASLLSGLHECFQAISQQAGLQLRSFAIMPDHVHLAVQGDPARSPRELGTLFQNASARVAGCRLWQDDFYVGTFSEYDMSAIQD